MDKRKRDYIRIIIALIVLTLIVFIFDLPKTSSFITIGVIAAFNILLRAVMGTKNNE